jgi:hypothetical protein
MPSTRICGHDLILSGVPFRCWSAGEGCRAAGAAGTVLGHGERSTEATIGSAIPPAVPMPASPQSNPLGAATRTITGGALTEWLGLVACMLPHRMGRTSRSR